MAGEEYLPDHEIRWRKAAGFPFPKVIKPVAVRKCRSHTAPLAQCWLVWVYIEALRTYVFGASFSTFAEAVAYAVKTERSSRVA